MTIIEIMGWAGALMLGICALPQAISSYRNKDSSGISLSFLMLWLGGEVLTLLYIVSTSMQLPLVVNYLFNILCLSVILFYWRKEK